MLLSIKLQLNFCLCVDGSCTSIPEEVLFVLHTWAELPASQSCPFRVGFPNYHRANSRLNKNQTCLSSSVEHGEHFLCFNKCKVPFVMHLSANFTTPGKFRYDISVLHYAKSPQLPDNRIFTIALVMGSKIILLLGT